MSDPTPPPGGGDQYPPADQPGGYPPPAAPPPQNYPPPAAPPPQGYPPPAAPPPQPGYPPPQQQGYPPPQPGGGGYPPPDQPYGQAQPFPAQPYPPQPYGAPSGGSSGSLVTLMNGNTVKVADGGKRAIARIIDAVIVAVIFGIFYAIVVGVFIGTAETTFNPDTNEFETTGLEGVGLFVVLILLLIVAQVMYEVAFVAIKGQTPGKMIIGTKIVNQASGELVGWGPAFMRWLPIGIGNFLCGLGWLVYLSAYLDKSGRLQGWHDNMAKDLVIDLK